MQIYDIIMLVVFGGAVLWGLWKGFAWQVASIAGIVLSYFMAATFREPLAAQIDAEPPWNMFLAMLILFLGTALAIWIGFNMIRRSIEKTKLKDFDRQVGGVLGAVKGGILCIVITLFSVTLLSDSQKEAICNSYSGYIIATVLDQATPIMPKEVHNVVGPYLERLDHELDHEKHPERHTGDSSLLTGGTATSGTPTLDGDAGATGTGPALPPGSDPTGMSMSELEKSLGVKVDPARSARALFKAVEEYNRD